VRPATEQPSEPAAISDVPALRYTNLFTVPLATRVWDDGGELNAALREHILSHQAAHPGVGKSNQGGWHSETGRLEFCGEAGRRLVGHMQALAEEATRLVFAERGAQPPALRWRLSAWANVNRSGDFNRVHVHPESTWSGTYYVDTGEPDGGERGAPLHLFDPCPGRSMTFFPMLAPSVFVHPRPGLMVLFPSYVPHMVFPHRGGGTRISIAFNLRADPA